MVPSSQREQNKSYEMHSVTSSKCSEVVEMRTSFREYDEDESKADHYEFV